MSILISGICPYVAATCGKKIGPVSLSMEKLALRELSKINEHTLDVYARQKASVKKTLGDEIPVILSNGDLLVSRYRKVRKEIKYVPDLYHGLKAIAHIPIAIHSSIEKAQKILPPLEALFKLHC